MPPAKHQQKQQLKQQKTAIATYPMDGQGVKRVGCLQRAMHTVCQRNGAHISCIGRRHFERIGCAGAAAAVGDDADSLRG